MNTKDSFKVFVKKNPSLIKHVQDGTMTWQKFYEIYDMYGEDDSVWKEYLNKSVNSSTGLFDYIKNLDLDSIQSGVNSVQRVISLFQEMSSKNDGKNTNNEEYKPRPVYKHFED
ncbi:MAG: hypothetical protein IKG27_04070 [Bacilli bacterium]|nr:hypothetical protein [Bacilli bacterium]